MDLASWVQIQAKVICIYIIGKGMNPPFFLTMVTGIV